MSSLAESVKEGKVSEETINTACRRILEAKYRLGLFNDPYKYCDVNMAGTWCVSYTPDKYSTLKEAMERALDGKATLLYAQGSNVWHDAQLQKDGEFGKTIDRTRYLDYCLARAQYCPRWGNVLPQRGTKSYVVTQIKNQVYAAGREITFSTSHFTFSP